MNTTDFANYLLKNLAVLEPTTADLARRVLDGFDDKGATWNELKKDSIERVIGSLRAVLILKFERKTEEILVVALKKIITIL